MKQKHNALWNTAEGLSIKVWADGGCIWAARPFDPSRIEQANYETDEMTGVHHIVGTKTDTLTFFEVPWVEVDQEVCGDCDPVKLSFSIRVF